MNKNNKENDVNVKYDTCIMNEHNEYDCSSLENLEEEISDEGVDFEKDMLETKNEIQALKEIFGNKIAAEELDDLDDLDEENEEEEEEEDVEDCEQDVDEDEDEDDEFENDNEDDYDDVFDRRNYNRDEFLSYLDENI